jgi:hypothetical protein
VSPATGDRSGAGESQCAVLVQNSDPGAPTHVSFLWRNFKAARSAFIQVKLLQYWHEELGHCDVPALQYPLHYARAGEVADYLFEHLEGRARIQQLNSVSLCTPLHRAAQPDVVARLVDAGADPNALAKYDYSPLHCVRSAEVFIALCERGARPQELNVEGQTPLDIFLDKSALQSTTADKVQLQRYFFWRQTPMESLTRKCSWMRIHDRSRLFRSVTRELVSQRFMRFVCGMGFLPLSDPPTDIAELEECQREALLLPDSDSPMSAVFSNAFLCNLLRQF